MKKRDYYEILQVSREANLGTIKSSYRKLALKYHPDRNQGDAEAEEKFKEASEAYEVLSNEEKRRIYDQFGHQGLSGQAGFSDVNDIFSNFGSIFEDFFGFQSGSRSGRARPGPDLRYDLEISFEEAVFGVEREIEFNREGVCTHCDGDGAEPGSSRVPCPTCGGAGQIRRNQGFFSVAMGCHRCEGKGSIVQNPCSKCRGGGIVPEPRKVKVKVPPGVDHGVRLRVSGEGGGGAGGYGDLYVFLSIADSDRFERDGQDIIYGLTLSITQATLGCRLKVPTLGEEREMVIPPGTQPGERFRIPGEGIPHLRTKKRGDLIIECDIGVPKKLNKEQREALQAFAKLMGEDSTDHEGGGFFKRIFTDS